LAAGDSAMALLPPHMMKRYITHYIDDMMMMAGDVDIDTPQMVKAVDIDIPLCLHSHLRATLRHTPSR